MSSSDGCSADKLTEILKKWFETKRLILKYEKDCEKYKECIDRIMDARDVNVLQRGGYVVTRRHDSRQILVKKNVPKDIWSKYASTIYYDTFNVKKDTQIKKKKE